MLHDIRSFNFKWIVPVDTALSPALLRNPNVWIMLLFGFYPLLSPHLRLMQTSQDALFTLLLYVALAWSGYFYYFVCKRSVDFKIGAAVTLFTAFIGIRLVFALWSLPPFTMLLGFKAPDRDLVSHLIGYTLGTGLIEELTKAVPVLILAYGMGKVEKPIDGIFYGAMSGLGFGIPEGFKYIHEMQGTIADVVLRVTTLPFLHALWAGTVGYFIGLAQINRSRGIALVLMGYAVAVVGHGVYDGLGNNLSLFVAALSYLLFAAYLERSQQMIDDLQRAERHATREETVQQIFRQTYLPSVHGSAPPTPPTS
jgi:RsiW-degrading membrane proteinase PrsW (M82 family)